MHKKDVRLWGNAVLYNYKVPRFCRSHGRCFYDEDPALGWGWLVEHGFDIIQSDWTYQCCKYLKDSGVNR